MSLKKVKIGSVALSLVKKSKSGKKEYIIFINNYKGKKLDFAFWGKIPVKFFEAFGLTENLLKKDVEVSILNTYVENSSLELSIKVTDSKNLGHIEEETWDEEEDLTEKELKTLMSLDWKKIKCQK